MISNELQECPLCGSSHAVTENEAKAFSGLIAAAMKVAYHYPDELPDRSFDVEWDDMVALRSALARVKGGR